jgi:predicted outer membrane repeat protein
MNRNALSFLVICAGTTLPVLADTRYVAPCGDDTWTGASPICAAPDGPKRTIQAAIYASGTGDTVQVADGTYTGPGNRDMDLVGRAITVHGNSVDPSACVIDCQGSAADPHRAFYFHTGETATTCGLEGFTIRNGWAADTGGAVYCNGAAPRISRCGFDHNTGDRGAAVFAILTSLHVADSTFSQNAATTNGGGVYVYTADLTLTGCTFADNTAANGGGAVFEWDTGNHNLDGCRFLDNHALSPDDNGGGAVEATGDTSGIETWTNCRFTQNTTAKFGGGAWLHGAQATVTGCVFDGNSALAPTGHGGAGGLAASYGAQVTLTNCLFTGNSAGGNRPGALWVGDGLGGPSSATIINCTFAQNTAPSGGAGLLVTQTSSATAANCILWGNTPAQIVVDPGASLALSYSDVHGGWSGTGNINDDPHFRDAAGGNYRPAPFSPCIDSGDSSAVPAGVLVDLDGLPRFVDDPSMPNRTLPPVDMGAYEFQYNSCSADFNKDGDTGTDADINDFFACLAGACCPTCPPNADFNGDGDIGTDADIESFFRVLAGGAC